MDIAKFRNNIANREAKVLIIGGGYVGLPLALQCAKAGFEVIIYDVDENKINSLNNGKSYIDDITDDELKGLQSKFIATNDPDFAVKNLIL